MIPCAQGSVKKAVLRAEVVYEFLIIGGVSYFVFRISQEVKIFWLIGNHRD